MAKKSERSLVLLSMVFVFACLLLSGGSRLIGCEMAEDPVHTRPASFVQAAFECMPASRAETGRVLRDEPVQLRMQAVPVADHHYLKDCVLSDANGNVLQGRTYMRAVYQAFVLDDGFV